MKRGSWRAMAATGCLVWAIAGCTTLSGQRYQDMSASIPAVDASHGRLYLFRPPGMLGPASGSRVKIDGEPAGTMPAGGFFYVDALPGKHTIETSSAPDKPLVVDVTAGETQYVRFTVPFALVAGPLTPALETDPNNARETMGALRYVGPASAR